MAVSPATSAIPHGLLHRAFATRGWLARVDEETREQVLGAAEVRHAIPGKDIASAGQEGGGPYGLLQGRVGCWASSEFSLPVLSHVLVPGDWFGHGPIFLGAQRSITFRALEPCLLLYLPVPLLRELGAHNPRLFRELSKLSETSAQLMVGLIADVLIPTAERRIAARLARAARTESDSGPLAQAALPLSQAALAELACVSRSQVGRVLKQWKKRELIEVSYTKIRVLSVERLRAIARGDDA